MTQKVLDHLDASLSARSVLSCLALGWVGSRCLPPFEPVMEAFSIVLRLQHSSLFGFSVLHSPYHR